MPERCALKKEREAAALAQPFGALRRMADFFHRLAQRGLQRGFARFNVAGWKRPCLRMVRRPQQAC